MLSWCNKKKLTKIEVKIEGGAREYFVYLPSIVIFLYMC